MVIERNIDSTKKGVIKKTNLRKLLKKNIFKDLSGISSELKPDYSTAAAAAGDAETAG
jgi:hypothetical protein